MATVTQVANTVPYEVCGRLKKLYYAWDCEGSTSVTISSASTGLTSVHLAVASATSGTYVSTRPNLDATSTTAAGSVVIYPAGAYDYGVVEITGI